MPGPGSHPGLTSHVSPSPSDPVTLTQIEYTQNIDTNTYPKNGYSDFQITCIRNGGVARVFATSAPRNVSLVMIL